MTASLHPRGTLRARFEPVATDVFRRLGIGARSCDLGDEGLYLAEELVAADVGWLGSSEHPEALAITVLALMIAQRQGSTRLSLDTGPKSQLRVLVGDIARLAGVELDIPRVLRTIGNLTRAPRFNSVIGMRGARLPLVVDLDCLYTERSRWLEDRVATRLAQRIAETVAPRRGVDAIAARVALDGGLSDEQRHAVAIALSGRLAVITGGPGTGKTRVAAAIVRGLRLLGIDDVALAAQTGKAANRLTEVIAEQLGLSETPEIGHSNPAAPVAQTLHRLLGYRGGRFTHHAQSPLPVGAVIVDEASMIDLELVDALLDALPTAAPLILIGDAHQLPAIDAGQVLADLTGDRIAAPVVAVLSKSYRQDIGDPDGRAVYEAARAIHDGDPARLFTAPRKSRTSSPDLRRSSPDLASELRMPPDVAAELPLPIEVTTALPIEVATALPMPPNVAAELPLPIEVAAELPLLPTAAELRLPPLDVVVGRPAQIGPLATMRVASRLIFRGVEWVDTLAAPRPQDVTLAVADAMWHHLDGPRALRTAERVFRFVDGAIDPEHREDLEALWQLLARGRVLTVTRSQPTGSIAINAHLHQLALDRMSVTGHPDFVPGEPVMITANDYQRGLFNGDQGIVVRADENLGRHHYRAVFRCNGELRPFAIEALRDRLELAWALTIHKSQGSELDSIALLLPHDELPLVTRELLYTGVTRARKSVVIAGSRQIVTSGCKRQARRDSGLGERIRARFT